MTETGELQAIWCCWYQSRGGSGNSSVTAGVSSEDGGSMGKLMMVASEEYVLMLKAVEWDESVNTEASWENS